MKLNTIECTLGYPMSGGFVASIADHGIAMKAVQVQRKRIFAAAAAVAGNGQVLTVATDVPTSLSASSHERSP